MNKSVAVSKNVWKDPVSCNFPNFHLLICTLPVVDPTPCGQVILSDSSLLQHGVRELPLYTSEREGAPSSVTRCFEYRFIGTNLLELSASFFKVV